MNIILKSITLHHFLSFDESTIDLQSRGFCLVSGINRNPKDAAKSNGAGKSTIWNAISFVLTGETLSGLKSNLGNIYFNDGCWVRLNFTIDGHEYSLLRSKEDKSLGTNLKIEVDGVDKSGKGIRESEEALAEILPDLTSELIGSVMILGQGMPNKFTNNSPSKRKEILEHLSKSDFMIQDLKDRVDRRYIELKAKETSIENSLISIDSKLSIYVPQLEKLNLELADATKPNTYDVTIEQYSKDIENMVKEETTLLEADKAADNKSQKAYEVFIKVSEEKQTKLDALKKKREDYLTEFNGRASDLRIKMGSLKSEISRLDNITDVCPTCGQKIPNVIKPDTSELKKKLTELEIKECQILNEKEIDDADYQEALKAFESTYDTAIKVAKADMEKLKVEASETHNNYLKMGTDIKLKEIELENIKSLKENYEKNIKRIQDNIKETEDNITALNKDKTDKTTELHNLEGHLDVVSKMVTFLKRDFRGFLLENIINYISSKAKEYSSKIFGSNEIIFALDGNNIDIAYCNKDYENLSGGEKQRVDLIIQFAIRDMLVNYLGFNSNILVLDEITDNLDSVSCDKVLSFITDELNTIDSVFIISHHASELAIPYDSEIVVEKNKDGISEVL